MEESDENVILKSTNGEALYDHIENTNGSTWVSSKCIMAR